MDKVRVLVIEGSEVARARLARALAPDPTIHVVGETGDGREGLALCERVRPDVVLLGLPNGGVGALSVTEHVMAHHPTPILVVAGLAGPDVHELLAAGAVDALPPAADATPEQLRTTLRRVARIRVIRHPRLRLAAPRAAPAATGRPPAPSLSSPASLPAPVAAEDTGGGAPARVVALGASTGGPAAVVEVLRALPAGFPLPILLVVHVAQGFGVGLVRWLDSLSPLRVSLAVDGEPLPSGRVLVAPPDHHMSIEDAHVRLTRGPARHSCRPSVDVLFASVAREYGAAAVACLLTGMGRDGAEGLLELRRAGAMTVAQDQSSSTIFGMPREAIALGAARQVLPLPAIGPALRALGGRREPPR